MNITTRKSGFALISTLSIMLLIVLLTVAMLSLSTTATRTQANGRAQAEAQANARLALMLALGDLQKQMGPDQRISANGEILGDPTSTTSSVRHPHWTGVWDSWIAGDPANAQVNPDYPSAASHHQTIGSQADDTMRPAYDQKDKHFRKWLLSLDSTDAATLDSANDLTIDGKVIPGTNDTAIRLVGEGSLGNTSDVEDFVNARLLSVADPTDSTKITGRFGWWAGDESQKARIMADSYEADSATLTSAEKIFRSQAPGSMSNKRVAGLEGLVDETQLSTLPSRKTLDLMSVTPQAADGAPQISQLNFHQATIFSQGVLADVREGGLKRDLNTILEQPIRLQDSGDEFMLYRFDTNGEERVPIQDLAAYYQLYRNDPSWTSGGREGIQYNGGGGKVMQVNVPDYGSSANIERYLRQYASFYQSPIPVKVQFVIAAGASLITQAERDFVNTQFASSNPPKPPLREDDIYKLSMGIMPVVTLWNPNNVPLVLGRNAPLQMKVNCPPFALQWRKYRAAGGPDTYTSVHTNLNYAIGRESTHGDARARSLNPFILSLRLARDVAITFQPGEVRMFSMPITDASNLENDGEAIYGNDNLYEAIPYFPDGFYVAAKTAPPRDNEVVKFPEGGAWGGFKMVFAAGDKISLAVLPEQIGSRALTPSTANEVIGGAFNFWLAEDNYVGSYDHYRNYQFISRFGGSGSPTNPIANFNRQLMLPGFPNGEEIRFDSETNAIPGTEIVASTSNGEAKGMLFFSMMAGCETHLISNGGVGAGRRISTRPFLHGCTIAAPQISDSSRAALYEYGWEWQVDKINEVEEAFQDDGESRGFYGGGFTIESGTTEVVQQYLPALPSISITSLSSAQLGGHSLARNAVVGASPDAPMNRYVFPPGNTNYAFAGAPLLGDFRQVTATGQGGLLPRVQQAIGNSYAHPNLPPEKAFKTIVQLLNEDLASDVQERTFADHSYLANKALWDEFYFSSVTPQRSTIPLYGGGANKAAIDVAGEFLFDGEFLPNRRLVPYTANLTTDEFDALKVQYAAYNDGFADKIASHMMVEGPFNINSTSVEAWRVFFSSLKGKPMAYLENQASSLSTITPDGTPAAPGILANGEPINGSDLNSDPNSPPEQWTSSRSLSDEEIDQLAIAMVEQVKKRGPFLSLSEFINRRLDGSNEELALKGALQAALDDDSVSINAAFRTAARSMDGGGSGTGEITGMTTLFTEALKGPIAYGSTPYVDQADVLRHMGSLLTPRGDTFVIRAYGDSLDAQGNVLARAWCEAVVQRTPEYVDGSDEAHLKISELVSEANKRHGRKFQIVGFRWLNADEV